MARTPGRGILTSLGEAVELDRAVRGEEGDVLPLARERAEALLVPEPEPAVGLEEPLEQAEPERALALRRVDLAVEEVSVAAVEEPAVAFADGDRAVAARVAEHRDEEDLGLVGDPHRIEAEPLLAAERVRLPARAVLPQGGEVAVRFA
jgi:hypothetical protein